MAMATNLSVQEQRALYDDLYYLKVAELKKLCLHYQLLPGKTKEHLIRQITSYVTDKTVILPQEYPQQSRVQRGQIPVLTADSLMLVGGYKNDARARGFFKTLVGAHFHFTAYGIDWLNERWYEGNPPTYAEFGRMWQEEYEKRKKSPALLKKEWALLNFLQRYQGIHPMASRPEALRAWHLEREAAVQRVIHKLKLSTKFFA